MSTPECQHDLAERETDSLDYCSICLRLEFSRLREEVKRWKTSQGINAAGAFDAALNRMAAESALTRLREGIAALEAEMREDVINYYSNYYSCENLGEWAIRLAALLDPGGQTPTMFASTDGSMMCEIHPGHEWPHGDCPGPGMPWIVEGKEYIQALLGVLEEKPDIYVPLPEDAPRG